MIEYLGTNYVGFQRQPRGVTVQQTLEEAIGSITGETVTVYGSGRTDAGAHAVGQVIAFSTDMDLEPRTLVRTLNALLPRDIAVVEAEEVPLEYHPRYHAVSRTYRYLIWNRGVRSPFWQGRAAHVSRHLDERVMNLAAGRLVGRRDVGAFVPARTKSEKVRRIYATSCTRQDDLITIEITASGFMRQMVRAIAGTLIEVGLGHRTPEDFERIVTSRDRRQGGDTAPPEGLYLISVQYDDAPSMAGSGGPCPEGSSDEETT